MKKTEFTHPYSIINLCMITILLLLFVYSGIFSPEKNNYPIQSACIALPDGDCISTGMSRAFSAIVRLHFREAIQYNPYSIRVFTFFFLQFLFRISTFVIFVRKTISLKILILTDVIVSLIIYVILFQHFIISYIKIVLKALCS